MVAQTLTLADFDYELPAALIAQYPTTQRAGSRLLHVRGETRADRRVRDLPALLTSGDLLVFNDTRVINARLRGRKQTGGEVELLIERVTGADSAVAQMRASHPAQPGTRIALVAGATAIVTARHDRFVDLRFEGTGPLADWLEAHGTLPLPPYITHAPDAADRERYQTVYARYPGAVAAPTAGLHFDDALFQALAERGIAASYLTLHVGSGTFAPVTAAVLADHRMHSERYVIPARTVDAVNATHARGGRVVAVGTTSLRALEAAAGSGELRAGEGDTSLFITPGYRFRVVDVLLTNFHLPKSTLLMLVSAFGGLAALRAAYAHAISAGYRFMSYGDAMLLERNDGPARGA